MLTKEEWAELSPEEQEERVEEKPEEKPAQDGKPDVEEKQDRPIENYKAELDRKTQKIADLKAKITEQEAERSSELDDKMKDEGFDDEIIKGMREERKEISKKLQLQEELISNLSKQVYSSSKESYLAEIQRNDDTGLVSEYRKEIDEVLSEVEPPEILGNRSAVEKIVNMVIGNHVKDIIKTKKISPSSPTEDQITVKKVEGEAVNEKELQEEADIMGVSLTTPGVKKKVQAALIMKKKALEITNKE